jgi:hypothetical protein
MIRRNIDKASILMYGYMVIKRFVENYILLKSVFLHLQFECLAL